MLPPIIIPSCLVTGRISISFEEWALVTGFEAGMNHYFLQSIILAERHSGILLLMIIKAYQICEYLHFVICTAQSLTRTRVLSPMWPRFWSRSPSLCGWYAYLSSKESWSDYFFRYTLLYRTVRYIQGSSSEVRCSNFLTALAVINLVVILTLPVWPD